MARCRFSTKMNEKICFVCHEKQKSKQNKFICSFFGRIYDVQICFQIFLTFRKSIGVAYDLPQHSLQTSDILRGTLPPLLCPYPVSADIFWSDDIFLFIYFAIAVMVSYHHRCYLITESKKRRVESVFFSCCHYIRDSSNFEFQVENPK